MVGTSEGLKGNQNGVKLKDPELRQLAYQKYCEWLAKGKSKRSFTFVEGEFMCHYLTIESYVKEYPLEFDSKKREVAYAQGYAHWETICEGTADGSNKKACVPALNMVMRNKFSWDATESSSNHEETRSNLQDYAKALKEGRNEQPRGPTLDRTGSPEEAAPPQA